MNSQREKPWKRLVGQILLGGEEFVTRIQELIEEKKEIKEIPKQQRYAGRPPLTKLFTKKILSDKSERNRRIHEAHLEYGYTLKEIGDCVGTHYSTVSRIIKTSKMSFFKT